MIDYKTGRILDTDGNLSATHSLTVATVRPCHIGMFATRLRATLCPLPGSTIPSLLHPMTSGALENEHQALLSRLPQGGSQQSRLQN